MTLGGIRFSWILRRWWVLVASVLGVVAISLLVAKPAPVSYTAEAVLLVRSGATESQPGSANEANRLAVTYAELVPQDSDVITSVSNALGISQAATEKAIAAQNDDNTSILRVRFTGKDSRTAIAGANAIASAMVGANPAAKNFRGVALSNLPQTATRDESNDTALPTAILLGLILGVILIIAIERSRGRIESVEDLERELNCPVSDLKGMQAGAISALLWRWSRESAWSAYSPMVDLRDEDSYADSFYDDDEFIESRSVVALVTASTGQRSLSQDVAVVFASTAGLDSTLKLDSTVVLRNGGAPGTAEVGERVAEGAGTVVLLVAEGTSIADLRRSVSVLEDFQAVPRWALFAPSNVLVRAKRHHGEGEDTTAVIDKTSEALNS